LRFHFSKLGSENLTKCDHQKPSPRNKTTTSFELHTFSD
jgi:hypothetical protein